MIPLQRNLPPISQQFQLCVCASPFISVFSPHCMTAPAAKLLLTLKDFSSCSHMKGSSRSGTHDVGIIPAMYNSPTAGTQHVRLCSKVGRQASLSNWHLMLVMCEREGGHLWAGELVSCTCVCLDKSERCINVNCVI